MKEENVKWFSAIERIILNKWVMDQRNLMIRISRGENWLFYMHALQETCYFNYIFGLTGQRCYWQDLLTCPIPILGTKYSPRDPFHWEFV